MPLHYIDNNRLGTDGKISTRDGREIIISGKSKKLRLFCVVAAKRTG